MDVIIYPYLNLSLSLLVKGIPWGLVRDLYVSGNCVHGMSHQCFRRCVFPALCLYLKQCYFDLQKNSFQSYIIMWLSDRRPQSNDFFQTTCKISCILCALLCAAQTAICLFVCFISLSTSVEQECVCVGHSLQSGLTSQGRVNYTIISLDNGSSSVRCEASIWTNVGLLSGGYVGENCSEISIEIHFFPKMPLKMLAK